MAPLLELWMLGPWQAQLNGEQMITLPSRHARVLLARLVVAHPHPMVRAALLDDLFPNKPIDQALQRLRGARYYLRHTLGDWLHDENGTIGLDSSLGISCDVIEFLHDTELGASFSELAAAIARYRGPLLNPAPDGWAALLDSRIHERYIDALRRIIAMAQAAGDLEAVEHATRHWAVEEPWEERAHIALLQALIARGARALATAHLGRARALLRSEWSSEPSAIFEELGRAINRLPTSAIDDNPSAHSEPDDLPKLVAARVSGAQTPLDTIAFHLLPLIGRAAELDLLIGRWKQACQGLPQYIVIQGASGVGKSRLAQELAANVQLRAANLVLWCRACAAPAGQWLRSLDDAFSRLPESGRDRVRMACAALDEPAWSALCEVLPGVRRMVARPVAPRSPPLPACAALLTLLDLLSVAGPLLLVYDDMPTIDQEFVAFIAALKAGTHHLCVVVTRTIAGARDPSLLLAPLDDEAARHLIQTILGGSVPTHLIERLAQQSGGNPQFACDIIRPLLEHEALRRDPLLGWQLTQPDVPLPAGIIGLLTQRLEQISTNAHTLASIVALVGRPTDPGLLEALWLDRETLLAAQAELLEYSILIERDGQLCFDHPWLQQHLLASLNAEERIAYHRLIAAASRRSPGADLAERMQHQPIDQQSPKLIAHVTYALGLSQLAANHYTDSVATLRESVRTAQISDDTSQILLGQTTLALVLAQCGLYSESRALSEATIPLAHRLADTRNLSVLLCSLALCWFYTGDAATALPLVQQGAALSERGDLPHQTAAHLRLAALIALELGQLDTAQAAIERAEQLPIMPMMLDTISAAARVWLTLDQRALALDAVQAIIEQVCEPEQPALGAAAALWDAAEVLSALEGPGAAAPMFAHAICRFFDDLSQLTDPLLRRAFITARPAYQTMAAARNGPRRLVQLPLHDASTGRPLYADELMPVVWTIDTLDDPPAATERRSCQIQRLAVEALEQGAVATVTALADALGVTPRTIKRDLQSIRRIGGDVMTRRQLLRAISTSK